MLTSPITTDFFHSRVLVLLSQQDTARTLLHDPDDRTSPPPIPTIPPLSLPDTALSPGDITPQLLACVSPWIDLCSPDPLVFGISRQVLLLEVAYAAFCGIEYVFVPGPRLHHGDYKTYGTTQYARTIQEAINVGNHLQIHIQLPMVDHPDDDGNDNMGDLVRFAREEYLRDAEDRGPRKADVFGTWDAWNVVRSFCKYNNRLFVGKNRISFLNSLSRGPLLSFRVTIMKFVT